MTTKIMAASRLVAMDPRATLKKLEQDHAALMKKIKTAKRDADGDLVDGTLLERQRKLSTAIDRAREALN